MTLLNNDQFLESLETAFIGNEGQNVPNRTLWITMKRFQHKTKSSPKSTSNEYPCILRAKYGRNFKISTLVQPQVVDEFLEKYSTLLKKHAPSFLETITPPPPSST